MFGKSGIDYLDDESVAWMDENYDANQKRKWTLKQDLIVITGHKILLQEKMDDDLIIITR